MQTSNLSTLSNNKLDRFVLKIPEFKRVSFQHVMEMLKQIDENYPFVMPNLLLIIITVPWTIVLVILVSMIQYSKYCKVTGRVRHLLAWLRGKITPLHQLLTSCKCWIDEKSTSHLPSWYLSWQLLEIKSGQEN